MALAIALALLAAASWGASAIFVRLGLQHMSSKTGTVVSLASGTLFIGAIALAVYGRDLFAFSAIALLWFTVLGVINFPLGRLLNFSGVQLAGVSRSAPILASATLFSVGLGVLVGGEELSLLIALGTLAIVGGVVLIVTQRS
ncbi:MAG: EamA family transporter [Chloroflexi bacterium]|nr:EamA family transporter [Chloroflexota bacterium]